MGLDGRGTLISLRGEPDLSGPRGAGELPRPLLGSAVRGTLFDGRSMLRGAPDGPSLRVIPADGGCGTLPREAISGAEERVSGRDISGRELSARETDPADGLETFDRELFSGAGLMPP